MLGQSFILYAQEDKNKIIAIMISIFFELRLQNYQYFLLYNLQILKIFIPYSFYFKFNNEINCKKH